MKDRSIEEFLKNHPSINQARDLYLALRMEYLKTVIVPKIKDLSDKNPETMRIVHRACLNFDEAIINEALCQLKAVTKAWKDHLRDIEEEYNLQTYKPHIDQAIEELLNPKT